MASPQWLHEGPVVYTKDFIMSSQRRGTCSATEKRFPAQKQDDFPSSWLASLPAASNVILMVLLPQVGTTAEAGNL